MSFRLYKSYASNIDDLLKSVTDILCLPMASQTPTYKYCTLELLSLLFSNFHQHTRRKNRTQSTEFSLIPSRGLSSKDLGFQDVETDEDITTQVRSCLLLATIPSIELPESKICPPNKHTSKSTISGYSSCGIRTIPDSVASSHQAATEHTTTQAMSDNPNQKPPASAAADLYGSGGATRKPDTYGSGPVGPKETWGNPAAASEQYSSTGPPRGGYQSSGSKNYEVGGGYKSPGAQRYGS